MADENYNLINPRLIENEQGKQLIQTNSSTNVSGGNTDDFLLDKDWVKHAFSVSDTELSEPADIINRYWSSASAKFTDTRLGANIGINAKPQFTRYSDIRVRGRLAGRNEVTLGATKGNFGMGRYYSEAIDDPSQTIYMRFGVPQFNSLTNFLTRAFDSEQTVMARTGRAPSIFYDLGKAAGTLVPVIAFPAISLTIIFGKVINSFFTRPTSKFYTLKPTMHLYWSAVNMLANTLAINMGILPKIMGSDDSQKIGQPFKLDQEYLTAIHNVLPDIFSKDNYFDIYALANKAQRLANQLFVNDFEQLNKGSSTDYTGYVKKDLSGKGAHSTYISDQNNKASLSARINNMLMFGYYKLEDAKDKAEVDPRIDPDSAEGNERKDTSWFQEFTNHFDSEFRDGSEFAVFKVEHTGPVSESFTNSTAESDLSQKMNSVSSQFRQARFSLADGNIIGGVGEAIGGILGGAKDVVMGALDGATFGFSNLIAGLAGSGYMDIPNNWQSSSASLPRSSYTIKLISPYNNPISRMQNIIIPLSMLLAGTLPLSTGKQSYTSPFLCQIFDRGRSQKRLAIIESLSITRGTSNLPFDLRGNALAIDVSFTVVDLSSIMHMPLSTGKLLQTDMTLDEDNILADYLAVLAGQDIYIQIYPMPKAKLTVAKKIMQVNKLTSPAYWSSLFHESATSGMMQYMTFGAFNVLEGAVQGSSVLSRQGVQ